MNQKLTTKREQDAWIQKAVKAGMADVEAHELLQKMINAGAENASSAKIKKSISTRRKASIKPTNAIDLFSATALPDSTKNNAEANILAKVRSTAPATEISQLPLWPEVMRSLPNEIFVRHCSMPGTEKTHAQ